jgi:hypothetical protein
MRQSIRFMGQAISAVNGGSLLDRRQESVCLAGGVTLSDRLRPPALDPSPDGATRFFAGQRQGVGRQFLDCGVEVFILLHFG